GKLIEAEREIYKAQVKGKPANVTEKIVDGKLDKFYSTVCLLEQGFIKNPDVTIKDLLKGKIAELGENIVIRRFTRYLFGEPLPDLSFRNTTRADCITISGCKWRAFSNHGRCQKACPGIKERSISRSKWKTIRSNTKPLKASFLKASTAAARSWFGIKAPIMF